MSSEPGAGRRIIQSLLLALAAILIAYAISDHPLYGGEPGFGRTQMLIAAAGAGIALSGLLPTSVASRILLLTVTSLVMLAVAETVGEIVLGPRLRPTYQADERLIFKFIPGRYSVTTRSALNGGETVTHRINSAGFRGDELRPAGEATRVVVYGDSFIHAFYTRQEETFVSRLGARLAERLGGDVEAVNAGVSSYGPDQVSLKMQDELPKLRPDLVLVAIFSGNDYGDLLRNKLFRLGQDGALMENRWRLDPKVRVGFELSQSGSILKRALGNVFGSLRERLGRDRKHGTAAQIPEAISLDFLLAEAEREYRGFVVRRDDVVTNTHVDYYSADVSLTPSSESARYKVALMQAVLRRIRDVAAASGTPLAFIFIPHPADVTDQYDWGKVDRIRFPEYNGRNQTAPLEEIARTLGVPYVSLYETFRATDANALYFHGGDDHWNAAGQQMAADIMADYLLANGLPRARQRMEGRN